MSGHPGRPLHYRDENLATMQLRPMDHATLPETMSLPEAVIAGEIVASNSPRKAGFNYGVGWGSAPKPSVYFDGVQLQQALDDIAHEASARAWRMTTALRMVRLAETASEKVEAVKLLTETMGNIIQTATSDLDVLMSINELSNTIDQIAPPNPKGYVPHMGLHYAVSPLRKLIKKIKVMLALSDS